ncbi:uncharacterized protein zgc:113208 isoform X1 [Oncorhynchus keta]|uniref:uncharacterized protein zgc:113208 isoform X1 n=2 Tax=Oncorhynchus keta TaxID=8018 RepID=UPI0015FB85D3|nr:uncharacterized protein zgc:113208 isoform X1 [Oncorhynchus keta]
MIDRFRCISFERCLGPTGRNITRRNMEKSSGTISSKRKASSSETSLPDCKKLKSKDSGKASANKALNKKNTKIEKDSSKKKHTFLGSSEVSLSSTHASQKMIRDGCLEVSKNDKGQLVFKDFPQFQPNMSPKEVLQAGSFGGTYFRPIYSSVTKHNCKDEWKELPEDWLKGLNIPTQVVSSTYRDSVNTYKVKCGGSLEMWESSGWIVTQDPYGWFQWYCRFYHGRRTKDDERQIGRWAKCAGVKGRWRNNLITKVVRSGCGFDNPTISPVVRQTLQHWGYRLTKEDYNEGAKRVKPK